MTHKIEVYAGAEPLKLLRRRVPLHHMQVLQDKLDVCSEKGLIALSHSPYSAPAIMMPKKWENTSRQRLLPFQEKSSWPIPSVQENFVTLEKTAFVWTIDLSVGLYRALIDTSS